MRLRVSGQGNFDRLGEPVLKDPPGWRAYPPTKTFKAEDDLGSKGTKTFEMAVVPETPKTAMPVFEFSFFDPKAEKYVTLSSAPEYLMVEGGAPPAPAKPSSVPAETAKAPTPAPSQPASDILGLRYGRDEPRSFVPWHERREFLLTQGALGVVLAGVLAWRLRRRPDAAHREVAALRKEKASALARLHSGKLDEAVFLETAARVAQIETALKTGQPAGAVDAAAVRTAFQLDAATAEVIDQIFDTRAKLLYAGSAGDARVKSEVGRAEIVSALERLGKAHGRN
jgi:hypothetical protein